MERYELTQIMREHGEYLTRLAYVYVKSWAVAEDIVQDVFVKFYETELNFKQQSSVKTYLAKMTINKSCDYLRSIKRRLGILQKNSKILLSAAQSAEERTVSRLMENEVARCVLDLPIKYREVIVLYYYEELTTSAIASLLSISENTVKTRLVRGREKLKKSLAPINEGVFAND